MRARAQGLLVGGVGVSALLAVFGAPASAQEVAPHVRLVFEAGRGAETCVSSEELERLVEVQLGRPVFTREESVAATIRVTLEISAETRGFRAFVRAEREAPSEGEPAAPARELVSEGDCHALDEQLTLVVALLVDAETAKPAPTTAPEPPPPPPEPEPPPEDPQPLGPVSSAPAWEAAQRNAPWHLEVNGAAAVGIGVTPNVGLGAELGFFAVPPGLPGLRVRALLLGSRPAELTPDASVSFTFGMGGIALCPPIVASGPGRLFGCVTADAGFAHATSHGLEEGRETTRFVPMFGVSIRGTLKLGGSWLGVASVGVSLPTQADRFVYRQDRVEREIFQMAPLPFFATLGVSYELL